MTKKYSDDYEEKIIENTILLEIQLSLDAYLF